MWACHKMPKHCAYTVIQWEDVNRQRNLFYPHPRIGRLRVEMHSTWLANAALCHMSFHYIAEKVEPCSTFLPNKPAFLFLRPSVVAPPLCQRSGLIGMKNAFFHTVLLSVWTWPLLHCSGSWDAQRNHCVLLAWQIEHAGGSAWEKEHSHAFMGDNLYFQTNLKQTILSRPVKTIV